MIYEQNMMKCDDGEKYTELSCFDHKFCYLVAILKRKTAILNGWHAHEEWYYYIGYDLWTKYDKMCWWQKGHKIFMFDLEFWHFGSHFEKEGSHFEWLTCTWRMVFWYRIWFMNKIWWNLLLRKRTPNFHVLATNLALWQPFWKGRRPFWMTDTYMKNGIMV